MVQPATLTDRKAEGRENGHLLAASSDVADVTVGDIAIEVCSFHS
jgi:hypothetical protein